MQEKPIFLSSYLWYYCYGKAKQFKYQLADLAPSSALRWSSVSASPSSSASASRFFPGDSSLGEKLKACQLWIANTDCSRKEAHEDCVCFVWKLERAEERSRKNHQTSKNNFFFLLAFSRNFPFKSPSCVLPCLKFHQRLLKSKLRTNLLRVLPSKSLPN